MQQDILYRLEFLFYPNRLVVIARQRRKPLSNVRCVKEVGRFYIDDTLDFARCVICAVQVLQFVDEEKSFLLLIFLLYLPDDVFQFSP